MKINLYSSPMDGCCGIGLYAKKVMDNLRRRGIVVKPIIVDVNKSNPLYFIRKANELARADVVHIEFEYDFMGCKPINSILTPLIYSYLKLLSLFRGFKIVTVLHNVWQKNNPPRYGFLGSIYVRFVNFFIHNFSDRLLARSEELYERALNEGVDEKKLVLLPHGADKPVFLNKQECKHKLGFGDKKLVTIFGYIRTSQGVDLKGHDLVIEASKHLPEDIVVLIAGGTHNERDQKYLEGLKKKAGNNVVFYDYVPDEKIPIILNATDIMVLPYREVGASGIVRWALTYQIPTVVSSLPFFTRLQDKYNCLLISNTNPQKLAKDIVRLLRDDQLYNQLKKASKQYYDDNRIERTIDILLKIYGELTNRK
jgi:glycosyltransferase involved in cell wall biosynthesis